MKQSSSLRALLLTFLVETRGVRIGIAGNALCGIATVVLALLAVWCTREIVDVACRHDIRALGRLAILLCLLLLARLLASKCGQRLEAWSITRFSNRMRSAMFSRIMNGSFMATPGIHSADIVNCLSSDIGGISSTFCSTVPAIIVSVFSLIGSFIFLLAIAPSMALIVTVLMPLSILVGKFSLTKSRRLTREIRDTESGLHRVMQEDISHRLLVATLGYSGRAQEDFDGWQNRYFRLSMRRNDFGLFAGGMVTFGFMAGYALMFLYCAYGLARGTVSFATMTALLQLVAMVQRPVVDLSHKLSPLARASVSVDRIMQLRDSYPPRSSAVSASTRHGDKLSFENVWFRYKPENDYVFSDFTADIPLGKITAIYGATGSGKTTLLRLILGLCTPQQGRIISPFISSGFDNIIYIPQGNTLLSGTILSNLLMGKPDADDKEINEALYLAAADFVERLPQGVLTACGEHGYGFSEGQAQRIAVARGLLRLMAVRNSRTDAPVLFLMDEPTSSLDSLTERTMLDRLTQYLCGLTVIIITHKDELRKYAYKDLSL